MAINPALVTTVQVSELPPAALTPESILAHQIGDILSRANLQDLVNYLNAETTTYQYEIKYIRAPNLAYITDNFDMSVGSTQGLGNPDGLWPGWAICNGNNGTDNDDGITHIGYGPTHGTLGAFTGSPDSVVVAHTHSVDSVAAEDSGTGLQRFATGTSSEPGGNFGISTSGISGIGKNMQPSRVVLMIMKL
jgi:hypothetical protein